MDEKILVIHTQGELLDWVWGGKEDSLGVTIWLDLDVKIDFNGDVRTVEEWGDQLADDYY